MSSILTQQELKIINWALILSTEFMTQYASPESRAEWETEFAESQKNLLVDLMAIVTPVDLTRHQLYVALGVVGGVRRLLEALTEQQRAMLFSRNVPEVSEFQATENLLDSILIAEERGT